MNFEHWAELLIPAVIVLIWLGKTFWKIRSKFLPQPQTGSEDDETDWSTESAEETDHPLAAFEAFLAEAAEKGINVGRPVEPVPVPTPIPVPAPLPVEASAPPVFSAPLPLAEFSPGRGQKLRAHPLIAVLRARPQQSIVLSEVLGKPRALREK